MLCSRIGRSTATADDYYVRNLETLPLTETRSQGTPNRADDGPEKLSYARLLAAAHECGPQRRPNLIN